MDHDHTIAIRRADARDAAALARTRVALFRELGQGPSDPAAWTAFEAACHQALEPLLADRRAVAWLAESDGAARGAAILLIYPRLPSPVNVLTAEGYLLSVWVDPAHRRGGVASRLVAEALAESRRLGLARLRLHATPEGRGVYARLGFRERVDEMECSLAPAVHS